MTKELTNETTDEENKERRRQRKNASEARRRQDPAYKEKQKAYHDAWRARKKRDPEWVAKQAAKHEERKRDSEWLERKRTYHREYAKTHHSETYEKMMADPEKAANKRTKAREYVQAHREQIRRNQKKSVAKLRQTDPIRAIIGYIKTRAKKRGIEFNLETVDLVMPDICPVLGVPIAPFKGKFEPSSASLDRIDPSRGYVKGNVRIISWRANMLKRDCTDPAELRAVADYVERSLCCN